MTNPDIPVGRPCPPPEGPLPLDGIPEAIAAAKSALKRNGIDDPLPHVAWRFAICAAIKTIRSVPRTLIGHVEALLAVTDRMGDLLNALEALDDEATEFANERIEAARACMDSLDQRGREAGR